MGPVSPDAILFGFNHTLNTASLKEAGVITRTNQTTVIIIGNANKAVRRWPIRAKVVPGPDESRTRPTKSNIRCTQAQTQEKN